MIDKSLYVAMTGASASLKAQATVAQNLANANTVGFQQTLSGTVAAPIAGDGHASRVAARHQVLGVSGMAGVRTTTGNALDVALDPDKWLAVQARDGSTAYTRAGNLQMTPNGLLTTAGGLPVLGADGAPVSIPPHDSLDVGADGTISIVPQGQPASTMSNAGRLQVVAAQTKDLVRGDDGLMRAAPGQPAPQAAAGRVLAPRALEQSNVDGTSMLVSMIQHARNFEMQVRLLQSGDENARSANSLLTSR